MTNIFSPAIVKEREDRLSRAVELWSKNTSWGRVKLQKEAHLTESESRVALKRAKATQHERTDMPHELSTAQDAELFRKQFDVPEKIRKGLGKLTGKIIYDSDFRSELGIPSAVWRRAAEREEFIKFQMKVRERTIWGHPETLETIRKTLDVL